MLLEDREQRAIGRHPDVVIQDLRVNRAAAEHTAELRVKSERGDPPLVLSSNRGNRGKFLCVHENDFLLGVANGQHVVLARHPRDRSDNLVIILCVVKLLDFSAVGVPQVHSLGQADSQDVLLVPVEQVQVVVVHEVWSVQDLLRVLRDLPKFFLLHRALLVGNCVYY